MDNKLTELEKAFRKAREQDRQDAIGVKRGSGGFFEDAIKAKDKASGKEERKREYRAEARRMVSLANKRIKRLEERNLTDSPAYRGLIKNGEPRFSVKGKSYNELQSEVARMERFINANTSTIRGIHKTVKNLAKITNFKYDNIGQLRNNIGEFFRLSNKIEEYLRTVHDNASAIGYQKIWESVNEYIENNEIDLSKGENNIDDYIESISDLIMENSKATALTSRDGFTGNFQLLD